MKRFDFSQNSKFSRVAKSFTQKDASAVFTWVWASSDVHKKSGRITLKPVMKSFTPFKVSLRAVTAATWRGRQMQLLGCQSLFRKGCHSQIFRHYRWGAPTWYWGTIYQALGKPSREVVEPVTKLIWCVLRAAAWGWCRNWGSSANRCKIKISLFKNNLGQALADLAPRAVTLYGAQRHWSAAQLAGFGLYVLYMAINAAQGHYWLLQLLLWQLWSLWADLLC